MPRYESYGDLDSKPIQEMDAGFKGYNNFLRPDQLPMGVLSESLNARIGIHGEWQPRPGVALTLAPFTAPDFILPFYAYADETSSALSAIVGDTIEITIVGHSFNDGTLASVSGITGCTPDLNSATNRIITVVDVDTISITVSGVTGTPAGTATVGAPILGAVTGIYGAEPFYDDSASNKAYIILAGSDSAVAYSLEDQTSTTITYPSGVTLSSDVNMMQYNNKIYIFIDGSTALEFDGDLSGSPAFTRVSNGAYSGVGLLDTANNTVITDGVVTVSETAHGLVTGNQVVVVDPSTSDLITGDVYTITKVNDNSFTFIANVDDNAIHSLAFLPEQSKSLGYSHQPAFPWAVVHQNRIVGPYNYTMTGTAGASPTITDREVRDEIIFSRQFEPDVYDYIYAQFKFNPGKSDYVVGLHSFSNDQLVVLNRESIYVVSNSSNIKDATTTLLTADIGCIASETITRVGDKIVFLSDNGVYALNFVDLYNLRGRDVPLSMSINPDIQRINWEYAKNAEAVYFDNRYYLTVPIDGSTVNNALFVYNFLHQEWESIDSIANSSWNYKKLMVAGDKNNRAVYTVNESGGIHQIDGAPDDTDVIITQAGGTQELIVVPGTCTTRSFTGGTISRKKWKSWDLHIESSAENMSNATFSGILEDIDSDISLRTLADYCAGTPLAISEDASLRGRFGNKRGYGMQFKIETTQGRPKVRALKVTGHDTMNSTTRAS